MIAQLRASAIRIVASSGSAVASWACQVGAVAYSLRGMSSDANCRPSMPTTSIGTATGRAEPAEPSAVGDDELGLAGGRAHDLPDEAERRRTVVEHRQADQIADAHGLRKPPVHALDHRHGLIGVIHAGRRHHGLGQHDGRIGNRCRRLGRKHQAGDQCRCREHKLHAAILPIKNAAHICEAALLAKHGMRPYVSDCA